MFPCIKNMTVNQAL